MTNRHNLDTTLPWMREGTRHFLDAAGKLADDELRAPSRLPGWTRAHVIGHVSLNAEALSRLATWARTGVETPMYASQEQRAAEIEEAAAWPASVLRTRARTTADALDDALAALGESHWGTQICSALGRAIPATEIPWMRIREVWLHAIDLGNGASMDDLPAGVVDLLLDDVTVTLSTKDECPELVLAPSDRERTWSLGGADDSQSPQVLTAPAAAIAGWLTGRVEASALPGAPAAPRWL